MSDFHLCTFVLLLDERRRLLLARRADVSYGNGQWGLPGGHVEAGESLRQAAARETREEIGVEIAPVALDPTGMIRYADDDFAGFDVYFTASRWSGEPHPVSECDAVGWYDLDALPDDVLPWLPAALERLLVDKDWFTDLVGVAMPSDHAVGP